MKVSGFTFIRNAVKYDYPIVEAIKSILPICDEVVVAVGQSDDDTRSLIEKIDPKVRIIDTVWDDSQREGGRVLALETDKAFKAISPNSDWACYIQGDEIIHEDYLNEVVAQMQKYKDDDEVEGLLFDYLHFYGSYDYVGTASKWYKKEIRVVKNNPKIYSFRDAQGFRIGGGRKLQVAEIAAYIYHYGWVKEPAAMQRKQESFHKLWHSDDWVEKNVKIKNAYDYKEGVDGLQRFNGTHPQVMQDRISRINWKFEYDISFDNIRFKDKLKNLVKNLFGIELGYKNYDVVRKR